jgi:hypothetical protein
MRLLNRHIWILALLLTFTWTPAPAQVPTPESHLGFRVGADTKLAAWSEIVDYYRKLDAASDRVVVQELGESTEGRPFIMALISSPENLARVDDIKAVQRRLADPRGLTSEEAEQLIINGKVVVLVGCNIHATEVASAQMSMELAYDFATRSDADAQRILDNVVFLLVPSLNPDGVDIVGDWYRQTLGTPYEGTNPPWLYHKYTGHDNNRDWFMLTQAESQIMTKVHYEEWFPQIIYDVHQMGNQGARFFVPPFFDPVNPNVPPILQREIMVLGSHMALDLAAAGKTGVITSAIYDSWWHGGYRSVPYRHNIVGLLSEAASVNIASPIFQRTTDLEGHRRGLEKYWTTTNFPEPWPGGWWRLRDIVDYQKIAVNAVLKVAAAQPADWLRNFYRMGSEAVRMGESEPPYAYVIPPDQNDPIAAYEMLRVLNEGGVEIHKATKGFSADGIDYAPGTRVILMAQPYRAHAKDLLERQDYPDRRTHEGGPPERPYDVVGWTLPLQMGVRTVEVVGAFDAALEPITPALPQHAFPSGGDGYLLTNSSNNDIQLLNRLLPTGVEAYWSSAPVGGLKPGALWLRSRDGLRAKLQVASKELGVQVLRGRKPSAGYRLKPPRLALYQPWTANMDEGWTRWVLERYEFPYKTLHDAELRAGRLAARYDVILLPDVGLKSLINGNTPGSRPPEYTGGIGDRGADELMAFVREGGTLICMGNSARFALDRFDIGVSDALKDQPKDDRFYAPGSVLQVDLATDHPITYGRTSPAPIYFAQSPVFKVDDRTLSIADYPDFNPLMSGWIHNDALIRKQSALIDAAYGKGRLILFGFRPQHRAQPHGTFKMLFNAIYYGASEKVTSIP